MRRFRVVLVLLLATLVGGVAPTTASHADPVTDDRERFVTLWDTRFHSGQAFQAYLDSDEQYDDGYNGYTTDAKFALVDALVSYWEANEPGFRDGIDYTVAPDGMPSTRDRMEDEELDGHLASEGLPSRDMVVWIAYQMIFDKAALKKSLQAAATSPTDTLPDPRASRIDPGAAGQVGVPATPLDSVVDVIKNGLRSVEDLYDAHRPVDYGYDLPPPVDVPAGTSAAGPWRGTYSSAGFQARTQTRRRAAGATPGGYRPMGVLLTDFTACAQRETDPAPTCVPATLGTLGPTAVPVLGVTVYFSVTPILDPLNPLNAVGLKATVRVVKQPAATAATHAWVYYQPTAVLPGLRLGFGGSDNGVAPYVPIQDDQALTATVNLVELLQGALDVASDVTHQGTPSAVVVAAEYAVASAPYGNDTMLARPTVAKAPTTVHLGICHTLFAYAAPTACQYAVTNGTSVSVGTSTTLVHLEHNASGTLPDLNAYLLSVGSAKRTTVKASLPGLAPQLTVRLTTQPSNVTTVRYDASAPMSRVSADVRVVSIAVDPTYWHASAAIAQLPTWATVVLQPEDVRYDGASAVTSPSGADALVATYDDGIAGNPDTVYRYGELRVSNLPTSVELSLPPAANPQAPELYTLYVSATINAVHGVFRNYQKQLDVQGDIGGLPQGTSSLQLPNHAHNEVAWSSPQPVATVHVWGAKQEWLFDATVVNAPTYWHLGVDTKEVVGDATAGGGNTITAWFTNAGASSVLAIPSQYDNGVAAEVTLLPQWNATTNKNAKLVSAAVHVIGLQHVAAVGGDPASFTLNAGANGSFYVWTKLHDQTQQPVAHGLLSAVVTHFPGTITGTTTKAGLLDIVTSSNPDIVAYAEWGSTAALAQLPTVPTLHGLAVRDAGSTTDRAVAARLWLTGLPTHLHIEKTPNASKVLATGWQPTVNRVQVDIVLTHASTVLVAYADLQNVPTGAGSSVDFSWNTTKGTSNVKTTVANLTASAPMGPLYLLSGGATYVGIAQISNIPSSLSLTAFDGEGALTMFWNASAPVDDVWAGLGMRGSASVAYVMCAGLHLDQVPKNWTLYLNRDSGGGGPLFTYWSADPVPPAQRLDVEAWASGAMHTPGTTLAAELYFQLVDLGTSTSLTKQNKTLLLSSSGITKIKAIVSAYLSESGGDAHDWLSSSWLRFGYQYAYQFSTVAAFVTVEADDVRSLAITPKFVSTLQGDFSAFRIGWAGLFASGSIAAWLRVGIHLIGWWYFPILPPVGVALPPLPVTLYAYRAGEQHMVTLPIGLHRRLEIAFKPRFYGLATLGFAMTLGGNPGSTVKYWLTPDVFFPSLVTTVADHIITAVTAYGSDALTFTVT